MNLKGELNIRKKLIDNALQKTLSFDSELTLYKAVKYLPLAGGKRLRPIISMLCCESTGGKKEDAIPFGVALELVHNFTLVHDDIMDRDEFRRGRRTTHMRFGKSIAINAGNVLFSTAFETLSKSSLEDRLVRKLTKDIAITAREIAEGQDMDIDFEEKTYISEKEYLKMVEKKTARIIETGAMGGAIIGKGSETQVKKLAEYGRLIGVAFQIWDDILGLLGNPKITGKPVGNDIVRGKKTLIVIHGLNHANKEDRKTLLNIIGKEDMSNEELENTVEIFRKTNSIGYAENMAMSLVEKAKENLNILPESDSKQVLSMVAEYCVKRKK